MRTVQKKFVLVYGLLLFALVAWGQERDTVPNLPEHYRTRLEEFRKEKTTQGKILFLGNSITEGGNWRKLLKDSSVMNRGISGDNTFGVLKRIDEVVRHKPAKVFLLIGVNDLSKNAASATVIENIFSIVSAIQTASPATRVFVQSLLPINPEVKNFPTQFSKPDQIVEINGQLSRYAETFKYTYVDIHSHFLNTAGRLEARFTYDGLHLNAAGYVHWVEYLKKNNFL